MASLEAAQPCHFCDSTPQVAQAPWIISCCCTSSVAQVPWLTFRGSHPAARVLRLRFRGSGFAAQVPRLVVLSIVVDVLLVGAIHTQFNIVFCQPPSQRFITIQFFFFLQLHSSLRWLIVTQVCNIMPAVPAWTKKHVLSARRIQILRGLTPWRGGTCGCVGYEVLYHYILYMGQPQAFN